MKLSHFLQILGVFFMATDLYSNQIAGIDQWAKSQNGSFVLVPQLHQSKFAVLLVPLALCLGFFAGTFFVVLLIDMWQQIINIFNYVTSGFSLNAAHKFWEDSPGDKFGTPGYILSGIIVPIILMPFMLYLSGGVAFLCLAFCLETPFRSFVNLCQSYTFKRVLLVIGLTLTIWGTVID